MRTFGARNSKRWRRNSRFRIDVASARWLLHVELRTLFSYSVAYGGPYFLLHTYGASTLSLVLVCWLADSTCQLVDNVILSCMSLFPR